MCQSCCWIKWVMKILSNDRSHRSPPSRHKAAVQSGKFWLWNSLTFHTFHTIPSPACCTSVQSWSGLHWMTFICRLAPGQPSPPNQEASFCTPRTILLSGLTLHRCWYITEQRPALCLHWISHRGLAWVFMKCSRQTLSIFFSSQQKSPPIQPWITCLTHSF